MTLECEQARQWVDPWIDQELDPGAAMRVETHMAHCAGCRAEAESLRALKRALRGMREESAPTALRMRLSAALDAEDDAVEQEKASARKAKHARGFIVAGAALAGVVLTLGHRQQQFPVSSASAVPMAEDVARRHARELPAEVQGNDPAQVARWFQGKLDIPVQPVMFRGMPAQLMGARISNVHDQMAAALYYNVGGRRVTVFVFDGALVPREGTHRQVVAGRDYYVATAHGYTVTFTEQRGVGYAVATDLPPRETVRIVASADLH